MGTANIGVINTQRFEFGYVNQWTNPYETNGLVAMWDGEWNASRGIHDETIVDEWVDIINGMKFTSLRGSCSFSNTNRAILKGCVLSGLFGQLASVFSSKTFTIQYIIPSCSDSRGYVLWRFPPYDINPGIEIWRNNKRFNFSDASRAVFSTAGDMSCQTLTVNETIFSLYSASNKQSLTRTYTAPVFNPNSGLALLGSDQSTSTYYFTGEVCSLRFYDRVLSDEEIYASHAIDKARFNLP